MKLPQTDLPDTSKFLLLTARKHQKIKILRGEVKIRVKMMFRWSKIIFMLGSPENLPPGLRPQKLPNLRDLYLR
ncbi:hypothetical protein HMPREF1862_00337 [Varibaculum cambriense]|uniref:Uncharacterized protein n=1 Tax=Varibaculum cambriense TaxID=184870 RepID=A0AB34X1K8_9ACTO|nr:hypothetical protein HMPREF1862_00337 [Varibaculum cambriense]